MNKREGGGNDGEAPNVTWVSIARPGEPNGGHCIPVFSDAGDLTEKELEELSLDFPALGRLARSHQQLKRNCARLSDDVAVMEEAIHQRRAEGGEPAPSAIDPGRPKLVKTHGRRATFGALALVAGFIAWLAWPESRASCLDDASHRKTDMGVRAAVLACEEKFPRR